MESVSDSDEKLYVSSFNGDIEGVMAALAQGGRVAMRNYKGFTPLHAAAQMGHKDICNVLLAHGSDVHDRNPQGFTPLLKRVTQTFVASCLHMAVMYMIGILEDGHPC